MSDTRKAPPATTDADAVAALGLPQEEITSPIEPAKCRRARWAIAMLCVALLICLAIPLVIFARAPQSAGPQLPVRYLGAYERGTAESYTGIASFAAATGVKPNMVMYYSSWQEPFQASFAATAEKHGATPLVQINPYGVSLAAIAAGQYDAYLSSYAQAVRAYGHPVVMSFGHEMNGHWYPWGYTHTSPQVFVAAWRHLVTLFRNQGVSNVTWLWTVNIVVTSGGIPFPNPWWPGSSYVNWVGIDGYYFSSSMTFASLFGQTITDVRELTSDPILIAETAVATAAGQPAKIADLFQGVSLYGLLGFVWFEVPGWNISSPAAIAAYRQGAEAYRRPRS